MLSEGEYEEVSTRGERGDPVAGGVEVVEKEEVEPPEMDPDPPKVVEIRFPPRVLMGVGGNLDA